MSSFLGTASDPNKIQAPRPVVSLKQQSCAPPSYPSRSPVGDLTDWSDTSYRPNEYEAPVLCPAPDWADKSDIASYEIGKRLTFSAAGDFAQSVAEACEFDETFSSTATPQRQDWHQGPWPPWQVWTQPRKDTIVTRSDPATGKLQGLVIDRVDGDGTTLAWPGGMINLGDDVSITLRKELTEEAVKDGAVVDRLFSECKESVVYWSCTHSLAAATPLLEPTDSLNGFGTFLAPHSEPKQFFWAF